MSSISAIRFLDKLIIVTDRRRAVSISVDFSISDDLLSKVRSEREKLGETLG